MKSIKKTKKKKKIRIFQLVLEDYQTVARKLKNTIPNFKSFKLFGGKGRDIIKNLKK